MTTKQVLEFKEMAELIKDHFTPSKGNPIVYLGLEHIEQQTLRISSIGKSSDITSQKLQFKKNDILFGKLRPYFRKVVRPNFDGICSTDIFVVRAKKGISQSFLYYVMASNEFVNYSSQGTQGTKMPRASWDFLEKYEQWTPALEKQEKIGKILSDLDAKIQNLQNQNKILEQITQAIFQSWFVDFDGVTEFEDSELGKIPKGWDVKKIGEVIELLYGKSLTKKNRVPGNIPVYGSSGIVGFHNESLSSKHGIIVGRKGNVGSVYWSSNSFYAIDTVYYVKTELSLHYVYRNFQNQNFINSDSSVPGLSRDQAYSLPILIPKNIILEKFENISSKIQIILEKNKNLILTLTKTRDALLPKLMSGEIRV